MTIEQLRQEAAVQLGIATRKSDGVYLVKGAMNPTGPDLASNYISLAQPVPSALIKALGQTAYQTFSTGIKFNGTVSDYRNLPAADQVALSDRMAKIISDNPSQFTEQQVTVARTRIGSPLYNQPLQATGYMNVAAEMVKSGELQASLMSSAKTYFNTLGVAASIVALGFAVYMYNQSRPVRSYA